MHGPSAEGAAFLDTSAFVRWFADERESSAFRSETDRWPRLAAPSLRSLDAIHLATALRLQEDIGALFTYDQELAEAARCHGFEVRSPGA